MGHSRLKIKDILMFLLENLTSGFSVIVAPLEKGTSISFNLPSKIVIIGIVTIVVAMAAFVMLGFTYGRLALISMEINRLQGENQRLREQTAAIVEIRKEIERIEIIRKQIEVWAGLSEEGVVKAGPVRGAAIHEIPAELNPWPRQFSYSILRDFYSGAYLDQERMVEPAAGWISRTFVAATGGGVSHPGIDIAAPTGTPVRSVLSGRVVFAGWDEIYGNLVILDHGDSLMTIYGHNAKIVVREGDKVERGQIIATVGNTGKSTAPHLHFGIIKNGEVVDPMSMISFGSKLAGQ
ncbi:MAG: peptidoglycan DD-metalloendopeptidase family protein [bacterium]